MPAPRFVRFGRMGLRGALPIAVTLRTFSVLGCVAGCAVPQVSSRVPMGIASVEANEKGRPFVPSGTLFSARLDQPLDSFATPVGTLFHATVLQPLAATDGRVLVAYGARLQGVLVSVGTRQRPAVQVELHSVETVAGPAPLRAAVLSAQHVDWAGPWVVGARAAFGLLEEGRRGLPPMERAVSEDERRNALSPTEVHVPVGALMAVQMVGPLLWPCPAPPAPCRGR